MANTSFQSRIEYLKRLLFVYVFRKKSPLAFWYETPEMNERAFSENIGEYYMSFRGKALYRGPFDDLGIPLLNYGGTIGLQYNPIAISQYGLASYNHSKRESDLRARERFFRVADWLVENLEKNSFGLRVWNHHFDWPYRQRLIAPWYSGLAQGQGVSVLVRAELESGRSIYGEAAQAAFASLATYVDQGGVLVRDGDSRLWIEEYLLDPPSHILNGFIWGLWGVYDFWRWSGDERARVIFTECVDTLMNSLERYDIGYWSLYELPKDGPLMLASSYYHFLHVVQLQVLSKMTGEEIFDKFALRWERYRQNPLFRNLAVIRKAWFKVWNY